MESFVLEKKLLCLAVVAACAGFAVDASAQMNSSITIDGRYALGSAVDPGGHLLDDGLNSMPTGAVSNYDMYASRSDTNNDSVFFHTYGTVISPTLFGARASGQGTFFGSTQVSYTDTVTNGTAAPVDYRFLFFVDSGEIGVSFGNGAANPYNGFASLSLNISRDGVSLSNDLTSITDTAGVVTCQSSGNGVLTGYDDCGSPSTSHMYLPGQSFAIDFGVLDPGQSFTLDYDMVATVSGTFDCSSANGYGGGAVTAMAIAGYGGGGSNNCGSAVARSGDPPNGVPTSSEFEIIGAAVGTVPEPGTLALACLALVGLAGRTGRGIRKKKQRQSR
jgi:PEP-CTERM motif